MAKDLYQILQVPREATDTEVRTAYRNLVKRFHPDAGASSSAARFREIRDAYETLGDPARRAAYDRERDREAGGQFRSRGARRGSRPVHVAGAGPSHLDLSGIFDRPRPEPIGGHRARTASIAEAESFLWPDLAEIVRMLERLDDLD